MNEQTDNRLDQDRDEKTMARLLRLAGPRESIPPDIQARVFERVEREWKASSTQPDASRAYRLIHRAWQRRSRIDRVLRWVTPLAVAASLILVVGIVVRSGPETPPLLPVATVAKVAGETAPRGLPAVGNAVFAGDTLRTGSREGISLLLANGESLRVDANSAMRIEAGNRFSLLRGRVYADTGGFIYRDRNLVIDTPLGEVTDIGTQFSVATVNDTLDVAVREGRVDVNQRDAVFTAVAGERVRLDRDSEPSVDRLEPHDPYWGWASALAPAYDMENRSLLDILRWAARETGRELVFENPDLRMEAMRIDLHGSVADFAPLEAIESVLATTSFRHRIEYDRIIIEH